MRGRDPAARLRASLVTTLRSLRRCLRLPYLPRAELETMLQDAAAMGELEGQAAVAGLPGVALALAALAVGVVGGSVAQLEPAPAGLGLVRLVGPPG